ncbi:MAG: HlyC/CorC family transporter [Chromatiales bacterium]
MLSAFFSGSETALMTLNRYRLKHLADSGHKGATRAARLLQRPDRLIGLILLGNNFVNILASSLSTIIALRLGGEAYIAIAAGVLTLVILIFAEVAPKTLAALSPETLAFPAAWIYTPLLLVLYPLVWVVNGVANNVLKLVGIRVNANSNETLSQEELRTVVNEAGMMIPANHQKMLLNILDLEKVTVDDIMIPRNEIDAIDMEQPMDDIIQFIKTTNYTRIPVYEGTIDKILGFIHLRRCMQLMANNALDKESLRSLIRSPYFIPEGTPLNTQLIYFQRERRRIGLVVDEYGDLQGLVTMGDLLEEIVGEFVTDPLDQLNDVQDQGDGSYLVNGNANVRELVRKMKWDLPTDGPKTFNGLILEHMESIPDTGTSLLIAGYPIEILQIQNNVVKVVKILPHKRRI